MKCICLTSVIIWAIVAVSDAEIDYYWREYNGHLPEDAISAGLDKNNNPIYIAQAFLPETGLETAALYTGARTITFSFVELYTTGDYILILCSRKPQNLVWLKADKNNIMELLSGNHVVVGGAEEEGLLSIGRTNFEGQLRVGKVTSYSKSVDYILMYFPVDNQEKYVEEYEILTYDPSI